MSIGKRVPDRVHERSLLRDATASGNLRVLASMLGAAWRGFVRCRGRGEERTEMTVGGDATFDWRYRRGFPELARLYEAANSTSSWTRS
jgi:hypothetical protein